MYRNGTEKTAIIILIEKILISLSNFLAILEAPICCKIDINTTNKNPFEEGKKILNLIQSSGYIFKELKGLAANGNKNVEDLLKNLHSAGQNMINII